VVVVEPADHNPREKHHRHYLKFRCTPPRSHSAGVRETDGPSPGRQSGKRKRRQDAREPHCPDLRLVSGETQLATHKELNHPDAGGKGGGSFNAGATKRLQRFRTTFVTRRQPSSPGSRTSSSPASALASPFRRSTGLCSSDSPNAGRLGALPQIACGDFAKRISSTVAVML